MAEFGALIFPTDYAMHPVALAKAIEERGLERRRNGKSRD